jgi:Flp pilus assembly protein TadG
MNPIEQIRKFWRSHSATAFLWDFGLSHKGVMATEFALIAPIMISMYFGVTELSDGYTAKGKVTVVASTAADLTAQEAAVCDAEMNDIFAALGAIMFPYPTNNMKIKISSLIDDGNGGVKVAWSDAQNTTPRVVNSTVSIPSGLVTKGSGGSVIFAEVTYNYSSPAGYLIYGTIPLSDQFYLHPRRAAQIARSANNC